MKRMNSSAIHHPQSRRRAQLQTMETIAVLFVFFILLALAMIFYAGFQKSSLEQSSAELRRERAAELAQTVLNLPELRASRAGIEGVPRIDVYKVEALGNLLDATTGSGDLATRLPYASKFGSATIRLQQIYPTEQNWTIYDRPLSGAQTVKPFFIPVSISYPRTPQNTIGSYAFGILEVWYYGAK